MINTNLNLKTIPSDKIYASDFIFSIVKQIPVSLDNSEQINIFFNHLKNKIISFSDKKDVIELTKKEIDLLKQKNNNKYIELLLDNILLNNKNFFTSVENLKQQEDLFDLVVKLADNKKVKNHFISNEELNDYIEEIGKDNLQSEIEGKISYLKNNYFIKDVIFSSEISEENLLKMLIYIENSLEEYKVSLEIEDDEFFFLKNKIIAIDISNESFIQDDILYFAFDESDVFSKIYFELIYSHMINKDFKDSFFRHIQQENHKTNYLDNIKILSEYFYDQYELFKENKFNKVRELSFVNDIYKSVEELLKFVLLQENTNNLNKDKYILLYKKWEKEYINILNEYNVKNKLNKNKELKKEIYKIGFLFKYVFEDKTILTLWKDINILYYFVDITFDLLEHDNIDNYEEYADFIFKVFKNKEVYFEIIEKTKEPIVKKLMYSSFVAFINYFKLFQSSYDKVLIPFKNENLDIEKEFWDKNLEKING